MKGVFPIERKFADRSQWKRIQKRSFYVLEEQSSQYEGFVTFFYMHQVTKPLWKEYAFRCTKIADSGYLWIQNFPKDTHYTLTTMLDPSGNIVQWYADICKQHGIENNIPWFDDLYLDLTAIPNGTMELLDIDELEEAYTLHHITKNDYLLAKQEAHTLMENQSFYLDLWESWITHHYQVWIQQKDHLPILSI